MENIKSKIIPESLKVNIDEIMEKQLFNANRYYAESNPNISNLMNKELYNTPEVFLERLKNRWNWHNLYYETLLEPAYLNLIKNTEFELSPKEVENLINVYYTSCLVDEATLVMSGAIKKYLDYIYKNISVIDENFSLLDASQMLITPPVETFFAQYQIDHLYYIYMLKNNDEKQVEFKSYLKKKYHANDEIIFKTRLENKFKKYLNTSNDKLLKDIKCYTISKEYKTKHFYFTMEHSDRKAIRDIIIYDNLDEKLIAYSLIGISGFLLRKKILEYLNDSKILPNCGYIYEFNNDVIIQSLERLRNERMKNMDKDVRPYKQRGDTCAIVCMMMTLEYYGIMQRANWHDERRYYKIYGSKYMRGTPFSALAYVFSKNELDTTIYHSDINMFNNDKKVLSECDFNFAMDEYREHLDNAILKGTKVANGVDINTELLRTKLQDGNIVILAGEIPGGYHAILLSGYKDNNFIVCDPLDKNKQIKTKEEIEEFMDTSIGKWFIAVNDRTREKDNLLKNLDKFNEESKVLMNIKEGRSLSHVKK